MSKIALLFPGQGSQYVGMGKSLCGMSAAAREVFEEANHVLGFNLQKLCFEGSMEELTKTENTQPALLTASVAAFRVYMQEIGVKPEFTAGHSLGEISALCCSDAISFSDAVKIVRQRGKFMQEAVAIGVGGMAAVSGVDKSAIVEECERVSKEGSVVVVSNYNSPEQIVISGHINAVGAVGESLKKKGARVIPLKVSAPFHSPLMKPAADRLREELQKYTFHDFRWPVISNVTTLPYSGKDVIVENLSMQLVQSVRWQESMEYLRKQGVELVVEMGPQTVLKNLMKKNAPDMKAFSFDSEEDLQAVKSRLSSGQAGNDEAAKAIGFISKCIAIAVCTKNSNWDNDEYQKGVVEPYKKVVAMKEELVKDGIQPTLGQVKEALEMLQKVFVTKKTPVEEQVERFTQLFEETGMGQLFTDFKMPQ